MTNAPLNAALRHIRTLTDEQSVTSAADGQLLDRFACRREEAAFAALMRRHGPMVLGVCRRVLGRLQDAEDAFRATFLLLARKAGSIRKQGSVGSWLHGVAHRLAVKAKGRDGRRQAHERRARSMRKSETGVQAAWQDLQEALDEALQRLPAHYRAALVACHLEGRTHEEAARQLGCPLATLRSRLTRGRKLLRTELTRRGLALSAGAVGVALLANTAEAAAPALLVNSTLKAALHFACNGTAAGAVPTAAAALAEEGMKAMATTKMKLLAMLLAALSLVGVGVGAAAQQAAAARPPEAKPAAPSADPPQAKEDDPIRVDDDGDPLPPGAVRRVGTLRFRQGGGTVNSLLVHPDGKTLVTGAYYGDRTICAWDLATGKLLRSFPASHDDKRIALSPDGATLAAALGEDKIALWNLETGKESSRLEWKGCIPSGFAFSPDGKTLAVGGELGFIDFWDLTTGKHAGRWKTPNNRVTLLAFAPDGKTLASGDWAEATVSLWDVASGKELHRLTGPKCVWTFAFSPDGALLASGGLDYAKPHNPVSIWDVNTGKLVHEWPGGQAITSVAFSPQGKDLAYVDRSDDGYQVLVLRDASSGTLVRSFKKKREYIESVAFSTDGKTLITGDHYGTIHLWDADTGKERTPTGGKRWIWNATLSPDGRTLAYESDNIQSDNIQFWDIAAGREIGELPHASESLAFLPDGKSLASVDPGEIRLWDVGARKLLRYMDLGKKEKSYRFEVAAFAPDGKTLALSGRDGAVRFGDPASGKELRRVTFQKDGEKDKDVSPNALAFAPDGRTLAASGRTSGTAASRVRLWDVTSEGQVPPLLWEVEMPTEANWSPSGSPWLISVDSKVVFSPDGHMLAMNRYQKSIPVWEAATGKERLLLTGHQESTNCVAFAPDGRTLASSSWDDTIRLWDLDTGDELRALTGHRGKANSLVFSADGKTLVSTGDDTTLMFWDVDRITHRPRPKSIRLSPQENESLWTDLADADAAKAYRAIRAFSTSPTAAAFLGERLHPARAARQDDVDRWIADLDSDDFDAREKATRDLEDVGEEAGSALRKVVAGRPSAEARSRAERLLKRLATPAPELLRELRAVEALESTGGAEAREALERLAGGAAESRLTREAKASLVRLGR